MLRLWQFEWKDQLPLLCCSSIHKSCPQFTRVVEVAVLAFDMADKLSSAGTAFVAVDAIIYIARIIAFGATGSIAYCNSS